MFEKMLLSLKDLNKPIAVYTKREETDKFTLGFVLDVSNKHVILGSITPYGFYDGYTIRNVDDIYRIETDDGYSERIMKLYKIRNQEHQEITIENDAINALLAFALDNNKMVSIELNDSGYDDFQGFVQTILDPMVTIKQIDEDGKNNGETTFIIEDITGITCDSEKEIAMKILSEN